MEMYSYSPVSGEYVGKGRAHIDPEESRIAGKEIYTLSADATFIEPPTPGDNQAAIWNGEDWSLIDDFRGHLYYDKDNGSKVIISELGETIPDGYPTQAPPANMFNPRWDGTVWIETALVYQGYKVATKADVDKITRQRIIDLGEEKAKTEKLIAVTGECALWDAFVTLRAAIITEGDAFVTANNLV